MEGYGQSSMGFSTPGQGTADLGTLLWDPLNRFFLRIAGFLPDLLIALCILLVGWALGRVLQVVVSIFLRSVGFDKFAKRTGITDLLSEGDETVVPHRWFGALTFWVVIFTSVILCLDQLRLSIASYRLDQVMHFILTIVTILVILVLGMILNLITSRIIRTTAQSAKIQNAQGYLHVMKWLILAFTVLACLGQIGVPNEMIFMAVAAVFVTLCVTFVIAFGVGGAGWAAKVLDRTLTDDNVKK